MAECIAVMEQALSALAHGDALLAVRVWSRDPAHAEAFAAAARRRHAFDVQASGSAREAVEGADIVCTVTASRDPVLEGRWLAAGAHVNAVGASVPSARELTS